MTSQPDELPRFSSSEEVAYKTCRLAHHFQYDLGYAPVITNRKLSIGIAAHLGLQAFYEGKTPAEIETILAAYADRRWQEIVNGGLADDSATRVLFLQERDLVLAMVAGYIEWVAPYDDNYETIAVEQAIHVQVPDAPCLLPVKIDLVQRHHATGRLRIVDFKTRDRFTEDTTGYQLAEQNGNYSLAVFAAYGERPTELAYRELRKVIPSGRSKPPYFREIRVRLTVEEMRHRAEEYAQVARERFNPDRAIFSNPSGCCGSWKSDWKEPCLKVAQGMTPLEALQSSPNYAPRDSYERYQAHEEET